MLYMVLQLSNYCSFEGVLYCRPHYDQLFKRTGSLDKSFEGNFSFSFFFLISNHTLYNFPIFAELEHLKFILNFIYTYTVSFSKNDRV